jgi:hypothetical protein
MARGGGGRTRSIKIPQPPTNPERLQFSFKYLQADHPKFLLENCSADYLQHLLRAIQRYSCYTVDQFMECDLKTEPHRHPLFLNESTEPYGFPGIDPDVDAIWTDQVWQFALSDHNTKPERAWRAHGFIFEDIFYVVWLDPDHALYQEPIIRK